MSTVLTFGEVKGVEHDLRVDYDYQPAERSVGVQASNTITGIYIDGVDVLADLSEYEMEQLMMRVDNIIHDEKEAA